MKSNVISVVLLALAAVCLLPQCKKSVHVPVDPDYLDSLGAWKSVRPGGVNGNITSLWFTDAANGFFGTGTGQIFQSTDSGKNWLTLGKVSQSNVMRIFFYDRQYGFLESIDSLFITTDRGRTWRGKKLPTRPITTLCTYFTSPSTGFTSNERGVFKTSDTGNTWKQVHNFPALLSFVSPSLVYLYDGTSVLRSDDAGLNWSLQNTGAIPEGSPYACTVLQFANESVGYIKDVRYLYKTVDKGVTWTLIESRANCGDFILTDPNTAYMTAGSNIIKTTNGATSWNQIYRQNTFVDNTGIIDMFFIDTNTGWCCTSGQRIYRYKP
jgi:photosystem II stability/assembly factor-like uncharacterized protein